ncbi:hypothetical protein NQ318_021106 [Aromia moschata]|uniref:Uncharacterized protein n=1 Tax=Aromia moschata TaxID=1265417 RepID=A0AAV8XB45_9CUCU|nr:hypothetical protein NQ318_021106 [Aromia moschata]
MIGLGCTMWVLSLFDGPIKDLYSDLEYKRITPGITSFLCDAVLSFSCGLLMHLLVEMPALQLQNMFVPQVRIHRSSDPICIRLECCNGVAGEVEQSPESAIESSFDFFPILLKLLLNSIDFLAYLVNLLFHAINPPRKCIQPGVYYLLRLANFLMTPLRLVSVLLSSSFVLLPSLLLSPFRLLTVLLSPPFVLLPSLFLSPFCLLTVLLSSSFILQSSLFILLLSLFFSLLQKF